MKTAIVRKEHFNAAHRLFNPKWTDEENRAFYGKCNLPNYHGHNYDLYVKLIGYPDKDTGYVYDMGKLSSLVKSEVLDRFDHKNLNLDVEEFKNLVPSAENIARVIYEILRTKIDQKLAIKITLYETERNYVEYPIV
jgi:6-pyruvoyltetrahydropterin/6-carboxytetrahydropterin synthase